MKSSDSTANRGDLPPVDASMLALLAEFPQDKASILPEIKSASAKRIARAILTGRGSACDVETASSIRHWAETNREKEQYTHKSLPAADAFMGIFGLKRASKDATFLTSHGWTRIEGTRKRRYGTSPVYWRDPDPESLERMLCQSAAVLVQKERNRREGKTTSTERGRT